MKKIFLLLACIAFCNPLAIAQAMFFPPTLQHNDRQVVQYQEVVLLAVGETYAGTNEQLDSVIKEGKMHFLKKGDSLKQGVFTENGRNRWLIRPNYYPFQISEFQTIQSHLPKGVYIAPAYRSPGVNSYEGVFVPLPNVIVIDKKYVDRRLIQFLGKYATLDEERSAALVTLSVFNITNPKANAFGVQKLLEQRMPTLQGHVRFENQPLLREIQSESKGQSAATATPDSWNMDIIKVQPSQFNARTQVRVGILDFGCQLDHPGLHLEAGVNLSKRYPDGRMVDDIFHGTWMAGIIGAKSNTALLSVAPDIILVPVARDTQTDLEVAAGISYCIKNKFQVINMSFGRGSKGTIVGAPAWDFRNIDSTIDSAFTAGIVMVAASGDDRTTTSVCYPARHPKVIAVGASDRHDRRTPVSNYGDTTYLRQTTGVSVVAPGDFLWTTNPYDITGDPSFGITEILGGASTAAAHVSGFAAFLKALKPSLTNIEIRNLIESTADKIDSNHLNYSSSPEFGNGTRNKEVGYGRINIQNALSKISSEARIVTPPPINPVVVPHDDVTKSHARCPWYCWVIGILILAIILYFIFRKK